MSTPTLDVHYCIVGAGPAGLALAAFMGKLGLKGLVITKAAHTADTPRAHSFNPFGFECFRDIGIEDAASELATFGDALQSMRWCRSMSGTEYGRVQGWREHPPTKIRLGSVLTTLSPCTFAEFSQSEMEPLLLKTASQNGFDVRFSTELIDVKVASAEEQDVTVHHCTVRDLLLGHTYTIRATYLFGADGGRSHIARTLGFPFTSKPGGGKACNVLIRADLTHLMVPARHAGLHWILKPDRTSFPGMVAHLRMVRPWNEWVLVGFRANGEDPFENLTPQSPQLLEAVRELIGDESVKIEILRVNPWTARESVADRYDAPGSNVFILGDAAHRHPPAFGLGSNTCVQDAYNLAWKVAYVDRGLAGAGLLDTYSSERQLVGSTLVRAANQGLRTYTKIWECLGMFSASREEGLSDLNELAASSDNGKAKRDELRATLDDIGYEIQSLGICYNQWYDNSGAVYLQDEEGPRPNPPKDPIAVSQVTTYPGSRLPHAWLDVPTRGRRVSTHDIVGKGAFALLVGEGGGPWLDAAAMVASATGIPLNAHGIGFGLEYADVDREWASRREVGEEGCVLVRPDRFVAWRAQGREKDSN
ncbi:hypothetical protein D0869_03779 [Hortaea werneckii]|uniref:FAD-binding domain-containing protein n=1 Tax=Hortaea werneckii TaxID=91943 RepID=A0A3M6X3U3_HORWE|nr:hypothetical protein D0869_03779 [Hortaea werneckii]